MQYGMLIDLTRCVGCAGCVVACKRVNGTLDDMYWCNVITNEVGTYPNSKLVYLPLQCMHCADSACTKVCPTGASHRTDDGFVLIDEENCIGCQCCINACPYHARRMNWLEPSEVSYWGNGQEQMPFEQLTTAKHIVHTVEKCVFCRDRVKDGLDPACVHTCVASARVFGDLDDPESEVSKAIVERGAQPLPASTDTKPSIYYVGLDLLEAGEIEEDLEEELEMAEEVPSDAVADSAAEEEVVDVKNW